jgi:hypothetical protein
MVLSSKTGPRFDGVAERASGIKKIGSKSLHSCKGKYDQPVLTI